MNIQQGMQFGALFRMHDLLSNVRTMTGLLSTVLDLQVLGSGHNLFNSAWIHSHTVQMYSRFTAI